MMGWRENLEVMNDIDGCNAIVRLSGEERHRDLLIHSSMAKQDSALYIEGPPSFGDKLTSFDNLPNVGNMKFSSKSAE